MWRHGKIQKTLRSRLQPKSGSLGRLVKTVKAARRPSK